MANSNINAFKTDTGIEVVAITTDQMREVDRIAMEETGPNLFQMMENAGRNLALQAIEVLEDGWQRANIVVLTGLAETLAAASARPGIWRTDGRM